MHVENQFRFSWLNNYWMWICLGMCGSVLRCFLFHDYLFLRNFPRSLTRSFTNKSSKDVWTLKHYNRRKGFAQESPPFYRLFVAYQSGPDVRKVITAYNTLNKSLSSGKRGLPCQHLSTG